MREYLSAYFINEANFKNLLESCHNDILPSVPGAPVEFEIGKVLVIQTIATDDLFDEDAAENTRHNVWVATRELFDKKFVITDDVPEESFAMIARK